MSKVISDDKLDAKDLETGGLDTHSEEFIPYTGDLDPKKYGHLERGLVFQLHLEL